MVTFTGSRFNEAELRSHIKLKPGKRFDHFDWQDDRERIRHFHEQQFYEASVVARRRDTTEENQRPGARADL